VGHATRDAQTIPGYGDDVQASRAEARKIMEKLGYGPNKRLAVKVSTRNIAVYRDPAVILIDQLKDIHINGELEVVETSNWHAKVTRKDYAVGLNLTGNSVDDPDQNFSENYACGSERNFIDYCNKDLEKLFDRQSSELDPAKRKQLVFVLQDPVPNKRRLSKWQVLEEKFVAIGRKATFVRSRQWRGRTRPQDASAACSSVPKARSGKKLTPLAFRWTRGSSDANNCREREARPSAGFFVRPSVEVTPSKNQ
jgi:hypothetical protein